MRAHSRAAVATAILALSLVAAGPPGDQSGQGPPSDHPGQGRGPVESPPGEQPDLAPADYIDRADELSEDEYSEIVTERFDVEAHDGETLSVLVTRPDPDEYPELYPDGGRDGAEGEAGGGLPVIMEASPYHGTLADYDGIRIFPDPEDEDGAKLGLTGYFAPRGYAVAMVALRGTDRSTGCLDHLGPDDAKDLRDVVEWAAAADWSNGRVGMTGHSYVGSTPSVAAAMDPEGLVTIAPSAGLASMYDHQFHQGVPWFLQYIGPVIAYEQLALERDLPGGANFEHAGPNPQVGCGLLSSAALAGHGQVTGQYQNWHAERDHRAGAAAADIPIFMIHGVNDDAARIPAAEWFFGDRTPRDDDKVWVGQWDHGSAGATTCEEADDSGHVNCRFDQWQYALHAWFDHHLKGMDVDTGPTVEAFLNGEVVSTAETWDAMPGTLALYPDASDGTLRTEPPSEGAEASFAALAGEGSVEFVSETLDESVLRGLPELDLVASVTGQVVHLVTTLWVEDGDGERRAANHCATNTHLRNDVATPALTIPGQPMDLSLQCFTQAHHVAAGERLVLEVGTTSEHHVPSFATDARVTVHTGPQHGAYRLPLVEGAELYEDVPLFEPDEDG